MAWRRPVILRDCLRKMSGQHRESLPFFRMRMRPGLHYHENPTIQSEYQGKPAKRKAQIGVSDSAVSKGTLRPKLLHQQHLARALDGASQPALIMRRQAGVFSGKEPALIGDELAEQIGILEIERVRGEVNLGFRSRRARFHRSMGTLAI